MLSIEIDLFCLFPCTLEPTIISALLFSNGLSSNSKSEKEYVPSASINTTISAPELPTASRIALPFPLSLSPFFCYSLQLFVFLFGNRDFDVYAFRPIDIK